MQNGTGAVKVRHQINSYKNRKWINSLLFRAYNDTQ